MKMGKSLLLGSAAGLVAIAGAQAADMPMKAKPVEYVKICSLYGVGFYYIPGTDMCIKIGGWVRAEYGWGTKRKFLLVRAKVTSTTAPPTTGLACPRLHHGQRAQPDRIRHGAWLYRGRLSGSGVNGAGNTFGANRAFIQWAGFTFGRAQSFFDFYSKPATSYWGAFPSSDTGDRGWKVSAIRRSSAMASRQR